MEWRLVAREDMVGGSFGGDCEVSSGGDGGVLSKGRVVSVKRVSEAASMLRVATEFLDESAEDIMICGGKTSLRRVS